MLSDTMNKLYPLLVLCLWYNLACAQTDTLFWFAAPEVSIHNANFDRPIIMRVITYGQPAQVTISQPAGGGMPPQVVNIPANTLQSVDLTAWINNIENQPANTTLNYGLKVSSTANVTIYYEVASTQCQCNPEIFVLKGQNALGTDFFIPSQNFMDNNPGYAPVPYSAFDIVATQNNTTITITPNNPIVGHAAGVPFNITLNEGQTFSSTATSGLAANHLQGSRVTANKPIAITVKDDLLNGAMYGGCSDLGGDQIVPISIVGTDYVAMNSFLNGPGDQLFITATQNGTGISQNGVAVTTINAGQTYRLPVGGPSTFVQTTAPAYVWQLSGIGCEVGLDILPPVICTGSNAVSITRTTTEDLYVNVLVRTGGQGNFTVNGSTTVITAGMFTAVPGTSNQWFAAQVLLPLASFPIGAPISISNSSTLFHVGMIHGGPGSGTRFGYFSNFAKIDVNAVAYTYDVCLGDTIRLFADSILLASYSWTGPGSFSSTAQNPVIPNAQLVNAGNYIATATIIGCLSTPDTVSITVHVPDSVAYPVSICPNTAYVLPDGTVVNTSGTYQSYFTNRFGCDSIITTILTVSNASINASNDTAICRGDAAQLNATGGLTYAWAPASSLNDSTLANPVATPTVTTSYVVSSKVPINNLMINGDFSAGNTGFSSSYVYTPPPNTNEGQYWVSTNASVWNGGMASCGDHTTGSGNMLLVNGATTANVTMYCQTINVQPNTDYAFSTWLMTLSAGNPAQLQFSINGSPIGSVFTASNSTCIWQQFYTIWNSGANTTATICILNQNTIAAANDFALDDMMFAQLCTLTDTVVVTVHYEDTTIVNDTICQGGTYTFPDGATSTVSTTNTSLLANQYGCDSTVITNLTVNPTPVSTVNDTICQGSSYTLPGGTVVNTTGNYTDTLTTAAGCDSIINTNLFVSPSPVTTVNDTICQGISYTLPSGNVVSTAGNYSDTLQTAQGCDSIINTSLFVLAIPVTDVFDTICQGTTYTLPNGGVVNSTGNYTDTVSTLAGCDSAIVTHLFVTLPPTGDVYDTICQGQNYTLPSGIVVSAAGSYADTVSTIAGCDSVVVTHLTVNPTSAVTVNDTICSGSTYTLPDGTIVSTAGNYTSTFANQYGCDSTITTNLVVIAITLTAQSTDALCNGDANGTVTATATGGVTPYTYTLSSGGNIIGTNNSGSFNNLIAANYTVDVTDNTGCTATSNITVSEPAALTVQDNQVDVTCYGFIDGQIILTAAGGTGPYAYDVQGTTNTSGLFTQLAAGSYNYSVTDINNCTISGTVTITQPQQILLSVNPDSATIKLSESVQLLATTNYDPNANYLWSPANLLSCVTCPNPSITTYQSVDLQVQVTVNVNGVDCYAEADVPITVIPDYTIFIPNSFTPNADGLNDMFKLFGNIPAIKNIEVTVFNRIGEKVYQSYYAEFEWDGKYQGKYVDPGVYVYLVKATFLDNNTEKILKGGLTIIR
jgi:gliding motility-associated-like protein